MSLEKKIELLTEAVTRLTAALETVVSVPVKVSIPQAAPTPEPIPVMAAAPVHVVAQQPAMPPPPTFDAPAPVTFAPVGAVNVAPFTTVEEMAKYSVDLFNSVPRERGMLLQDIVAKLGHSALNSIRPDQFGEFYALAEALRA